MVNTSTGAMQLAASGDPASGGLSEQVRDRVERALDLLRHHGGRRTPGRRAVLQTLASTSEHLTVSEIHDRIDQNGLFGDRSAVHRTVTTFVELGVVHTLPVPGDAAYGLVYPPHHHAICTRCGGVSTLPAEALTLAVAVAEAASGFALDPAGLALLGVCPGCNAFPAPSRSGDLV